MSFVKLPTNAEALLNEIMQAENATKLLCDKFDNLSSKEDDELRAILRQLREAGYINISWADNKPYNIFISNSARTYNEQLAEYEKNQVTSATIINNSITIGDGNKINKSHLSAGSNQINESEMMNKKSFDERHPVVISIIISLVTGLILMFSFWDSLVKWIEELF